MAASTMISCAETCAGHTAVCCAIDGAEFLSSVHLDATVMLQYIRWPSKYLATVLPSALLHLLTLAAGAQFGCAEVDDELVRRVEGLTGVPAHPFLKRKVFYAHRDLAQLLDAYEKGEPFYLYTGRVRYCCHSAGCYGCAAAMILQAIVQYGGATISAGATVGVPSTHETTMAATSSPLGLPRATRPAGHLPCAHSSMLFLHA